MPKLSLFAKPADGVKAKDSKIILVALLAAAFVIRFLLLPDLNSLNKLLTEKKIKVGELNQKKGQFFSTEELLKNPQKYEEEYNRFEKILGGLDEKIKLLKSKLVDKNLVSEVLNYLTDGTNPDKVRFNLIKMEPLVSGEYFNELPIEMKMTCDFYSFLRYIHAIESMTTLINVKKIKLTSPEVNGLVNVEANLIVYVKL